MAKARRLLTSVPRRLGQRLGPSMAVAVEEVERLPRGGAGKLRGVISELGRRILS